MAPQVLDWLAQSYVSHSLPLSASRAVNMFAELELQDARTKAPVAVWGVPGSSPFASCGAGPVYAMTRMNDLVYVVSGTSFYVVDQHGTATNLGAQGAAGTVSIDNNGTYICWVDGVTGWYWTSGGGVVQITDNNFFPSNTVTFFDTYFVFSRRGTRIFFLSEANAVEPFDGVLFATKEATSDLLLGIANSHEQLYLFGEARTEVWYDAGNAPPAFPFQRSDGSIIQRGTLSYSSIVLEDNTLFFLGDDGIAYRLDGVRPDRISNHAVEAQWATYSTLTDCQALIYTIFGHKMLTMTFPSARATWVCDLATKRWHERESWLGSNADASIGRWRVGSSITAYDRVLVADTLSGAIEQLNLNVFTEFGNPIRGLIIGPPIHNDRKRVFQSRFEVDMETGVGLQAGPATETVEYCSIAVEATEPTELATAGALFSTVATFATFVFSLWVLLPDDAGVHGVWFGNQTDNASPGDGGLQIGIFNDESSTADWQIVVRLYDATNTAIVAAHYAFVTWDDWIWIGISADTASQTLQIVAGDTMLTAAEITWSSSNPVANTSGQPWSVVPSRGP